MIWFKSQGLLVGRIWIRVLLLPVSGYGTLGKLMSLSLCFSICEMG